MWEVIWIHNFLEHIGFQAYVSETAMRAFMDAGGNINNIQFIRDGTILYNGKWNDFGNDIGFTFTDTANVEAFGGTLMTYKVQSGRLFVARNFLVANPIAAAKFPRRLMSKP